MNVRNVDEAQVASMYGIYARKAKVITSLPIALASAAASAMLPEVSALLAKGDKEAASNTISKVTKVILLIAIPSTVGLFALAKPFIMILFPQKSSIGEAALLLQILAITVVFYSLSTISNAVLQGIGKVNTPVVNAFLALIVQTVLLTLLLLYTNLGGVEFYSKKLLGGTEEDYEIYARSIFDPERLGVYLGVDVTSKYSERSPQQYYNIASYINSVVGARSGNYLIFFPSHQFLEEVLYIYEEEFYDEENTELLVQRDYMSEEAREAFLDRFSTGNDIDLSKVIHMDLEIVEDKNILGFCVMGGIFSEGIDLKYDSLIGVIVVGTGIPLVCNEREILREYFEKAGFDGFDYAYRFPGMNKVLQAAGRVIRTEEDKGVVTLLDNRFTAAS